MSSDAARNDGSDLGGASDVDSLASTAVSEGASEYVVEDILAEREIFAEPDSEDSDDEGEYVTQYLVKWLDYPADSYSWEPKEQFNSEETLRSWELKKKQIAAGKKKPFSVKEWEKDCLEVQKQTQKRKEVRRRKREQRAQQKNNFQGPQEDGDLDTAPDNQSAQTSPAPQPASRSPSINPDASSELFIGEEIPPPAREVPCQLPDIQESQESAPSNARIAAREVSEPRLANATTDNSHGQKPSVSKAPARPKKAHIETPSFAEFGVPSEKRKAPQPRWIERGPSLSAAIGLLKPSEYAARTNMGDNTPAMPLSMGSPESRQVADQIAGELQGSITGAPAASSGETDMAATRQPMQDMPPPAPYPSNNGHSTSASSMAQSMSNLDSRIGSVARPTQLHSIQSSNISPGAPPGANSVQPTAISHSPPSASIPTPTQPRAFTRPGKPPRIRTSLDSRGPFTLESPVRSTDVYLPLEHSRQSSFSRASPISDRVSPPLRHRSPHPRPFSPRPPSSPCQRTLSPRRRSPARWSSPRRSPRRASPSWRRSPHRRSYSPGHFSPSRRSSKTSFPRGGDSWRPDSPPSNSAPSIASKDTGSTNLQDQSIPNDQPFPSTGCRNRTTSQSGVIEEPSTEAIAKARIARMPMSNQRPGHYGVHTIPGGYWWDKSQHELLMHVYFGPQKKLIGPLRLCGLAKAVKQTLLQEGKRQGSNSFEVWFQHLCTFQEFQELCKPFVSFDFPEASFIPANHPQAANLKGTAWVEGFPDNNPQLFYMAEHLRADDLIAIHYPHSEIIKPRYSLIAWSHGSPSFQFPSMSKKELPSTLEIPLLVAVHSMLANIESLGPRNLDRPNAEPPKHPSSALSRSSNTGPVSANREPRHEHHIKPNSREYTTPGEPLKPLSQARAQNLPVSIGVSNHQVSAIPESGPGPEILTPINNEVGTEKVNAFMEERNISIETLTTIQSGGKIFKASFFYLHLPHDPEIRQELDLLSLYLGIHGITVHTNLELDGWAKFHQNSKMGVVIFHESFNEYGQFKPALGLAFHNPRFTFWVIRIKGPLQWMDDRYCSPSDHYTRIFPKDGMILLTEDMLEQDLKGVAVIIQWLRVKFAKKSSSDRYHLMLHPGILEWIEKRLDDENFSKDHGLLGLIKTLIMKSNVTDIRKELFNPYSLDSDSSSLVVSHPVHHYGNRTEHDEPKIMDKIVRDADHLIEFFAGWALLNRQRFRHFIALTSIAKSPVAARWSSWGHINVVHGGHVPFFRRFKIKEPEIDGIWRHLCGDPRPNVTDQPSTPVIAKTPGTSWLIQPTNTSVQSPQSNDTVQEKQNNPLPHE